jgi:hypothetical protein
MKLSSRPPVMPSSLSDSLHHQLNMYALAAGAAGVSLLTFTQPAEAKIIYTKTHVVIRPNHIYELDLNHDGIADFKIDNHSFFTDTIVATLSALPAQANNAVVGAQTHIGYPYSAYALRRGATVGPKQPFAGAWMAWSDGANRGGRWANVRGRYLGLKFRIKGKIHYGWARLNVTVGQSKISAILTGYAYETVAKQPIVVGKTSGLDVNTRPPASLGRLAQGSAGISAWR